MIWFASWWSISEINNQKISMLGRDAHMISNLIVTLIAISYVKSKSTCLPHLFIERVHCETMNPGPLLIIRNTFPFTFIAYLFSEIIKTENTKTLYILHSSSKIQKYIPYHCYHYCHHPCIFIIYHCIFTYCFVLYLSLYHSHTLCLTTTW